MRQLLLQMYQVLRRQNLLTMRPRFPSLPGQVPNSLPQRHLHRCGKQHLHKMPRLLPDLHEPDPMHSLRLGLLHGRPAQSVLLVQLVLQGLHRASSEPVSRLRVPALLQQ